MSAERYAACTIVSKNYVSYARVLAESFRRLHRDAEMYVLLVDRLDGHLDPAAEPFTLVELPALGIPDLPRVSFQYGITELNTAVKPYFLRYLLRERGVGRVLYLDPDILVLRELTELFALLERHSVLLTPHLTALDRVEDGRRPAEQHILLAGTYNLGFIGLRHDGVVERLLDWWAERLYRYSRAMPEVGVFVDQRWIDLVPGAFDGVHVVRHPGYNVAYWNLAHRDVRVEAGRVLADGLPVGFFHFSGFDFDRIERLSRHQDRFSLEDLPHLRPLFEDYRQRLAEAGYEVTRKWPYAFGSFDNGVPIPPVVRTAYWEMGQAVSRFGDPFRTASPDSFWAWLRGEVRPDTGVSRLWYHVHCVRGDLQRAFPEPLDGDRSDFLIWTRTRGQMEHEVADDLASAAAPAVPAPPPPPTRRGRSRLPGVNVVGYAQSEKGVGEALRGMVRALEAADIPHCVIDFSDADSLNVDRTLRNLAIRNPYPVNLLQINADQTAHFARSRGAAFLAGRYNVGYWMWELPELPPEYHGAFGYVDEVWVGSTYCLDAVSRASPVPVFRCPVALPVDRVPIRDVGRAHFGLPEGPFVFLFLFDVGSVLHRKNPYAVIEAFKRAFGPDDDVRLVLKLMRGDRRLAWSLITRAGDPRVVLLDRVLERAELNALIAASDCYVSLHRSEGFGLPMAEAMLVGKPVIATGYSANLDFMNAGNSFLVRYRLARLEEDHGPYRRGNVWAEPDVGHAAELMRHVFRDREGARAVAGRGQRDVREQLSPRVVGERIARRLELIESWRAARVRVEPPPRPAVWGLPLHPEVAEALRSTDRFLRVRLERARRPRLASGYASLRTSIQRLLRWSVRPS
jgi:glycosyltransferase involved in cell wall biosynthesis